MPVEKASSRARFVTFRRDARGGVVVWFAIGAPLLAMMAAGAVELGVLQADTSKLQDVADAVALAAAKQMGATDEASLKERVRALAEAQLEGMMARSTVTTAAELVGDNRIRVRLDSHRQSFFGNLLPPGGFHTAATSEAVSLGGAPLCVLTTFAKQDSLMAKDTAQLSAAGCVVQANGNIRVENSGVVKAGYVRAAGTVTGLTQPAADVGAAPVEDPFANVNLKSDQLCVALLDQVILSLQVLLPGRHCGKIEVKGSGQLTLLPGEHYFGKGELIVKENAKLIANDAVLIFGEDSKFTSQDQSRVELNGRKSGSLAGFVMVADRDNIKNFELNADNIRVLHGVVYTPSARLLVEAKRPVADQSPWTVVVAKSMELKSSASVQIHTNYSGSTVPVPAGVGMNQVAVALAH